MAEDDATAPVGSCRLAGPKKSLDTAPLTPALLRRLADAYYLNVYENDFQCVVTFGRRFTRTRMRSGAETSSSFLRTIRVELKGDATQSLHGYRQAGQVVDRRDPRHLGGDDRHRAPGKPPHPAPRAARARRPQACDRRHQRARTRGRCAIARLCS